MSWDFNHGDSNILNIMSTRIITYDYNDEGARTKSKLGEKANKNGFIHFRNIYSCTFVWLDLD